VQLRGRRMYECPDRAARHGRGNCARIAAWAVRAPAGHRHLLAGSGYQPGERVLDVQCLSSRRGVRLLAEGT